MSPSKNETQQLRKLVSSLLYFASRTKWLVQRWLIVGKLSFHVGPKYYAMSGLPYDLNHLLRKPNCGPSVLCLEFCSGMLQIRVFSASTISQPFAKPKIFNPTVSQWFPQFANNGQTNCVTWVRSPWFLHYCNLSHFTDKVTWAHTSWVSLRKNLFYVDCQSRYTRVLVV